jgi:hypothetical protein
VAPVAVEGDVVQATVVCPDDTELTRRQLEGGESLSPFPRPWDDAELVGG